MESETTGVLNVTDSTGHTATKWNKNDPKSVEAARLAFKSATTGTGRVAFRTAPDPAKITEFDPDAEEITMVNQYQGG